jgi:hypothetical protein
MTRPRAFTIAAVLMVLLSLISIGFEIPNLMLGTGASAQFANSGGPPFFLVLLNFAAGAVGLVAAYGVWQMQKWGVVLTIALCAYTVLSALPAILFAPLPLKIAAGIAVLWATVIIVLLLRAQPKTAATVSPTR